jgi:hypothetical protein
LCRARHGLAILDLTHLLVAGGKEYWDASCTSSADLGPVGSVSERTLTGVGGHQRSPPVQRNHKSLTPAHAAAMTRRGDSDRGPEGLGSVVGQQMGSNRSS